MILKDLSAAKRREVVRLILGVVLQDLEQEAPTREVADAVARRLDTTEWALVGRTVVAVAGEFPEAKRSEAVTFKRYGQPMKPWIWSPRRVVNQAKTERAAVPASSPDDEEWTVYPSDAGQ